MKARLTLSSALVFLLLANGCGKSPSRSAARESAVVAAVETPAIEAKSSMSDRPLWGDTHLHTNNSFVYLFGTPASTPDAAYRFAKGEPVTSPTTGETGKLWQPLDFLVVADHAEALGSVARVFAGDPALANTKTGRAMRAVAGELAATGGAPAGAFHAKPENLLKAYSYLVNIASAGLKDEK